MTRWLEVRDGHEADTETRGERQQRQGEHVCGLSHSLLKRNDDDEGERGPHCRREGTDELPPEWMRAASEKPDAARAA